MRVPAIVYHQAGMTIVRHPALIIINGRGGDKSSWYAVWAGLLYARGGAVVLTYDPLGEFERNWQKKSGTRQAETDLGSAEMARRLSALALQDVLQGARYLAGRTDVDPKGIAVIGMVKDANLTEQACAEEKSLRLCVAEGGLSKPVAVQLNEKLKFPNWTKKKILAMSEAKTPDGGMALSTDIPAVPRDDLRALPDLLWQAEQDNYVFESWRARAKEAMTRASPPGRP